MGRMIQSVFLVFLAAVVGLGLGPLIATGLSDLQLLGKNSISVTNTLVSILFLVTFGIGLSRNRRAPSRLWEWTQHPHSRWFFVGATVLACMAFLVATVDSGNTSAWRTGTQLTASPGVSKLGLREFGRHITRLSFVGSSASNRMVGTIPVAWRVSLAGGRADLLLRTQPSGALNVAGDCDAGRVLTIAAVDQNEVLSEVDTLVREICGQWKLVRLHLPRGATELRFTLDRPDTVSENVIDIMLAANRPNFAWFWTLCTVLAVGLILTIVCLLSVNLRAGSRLSVANSGLKRAATRKRSFIAGGAVLIFALLSNSFMYWYVAQEKTIYTWDYSGYWTSARNVSDFLNGAERKSASRPSDRLGTSGGGPVSNEPDNTMPDTGAIAALVRNIRFAEYNVSFALPIAPVMAVFGGSRMVYELSLLNTYALAALIMLILAVRGCGGNQVSRWPDWWPVLPVVAVCCFVPFWVPIVRGYMGVSVAAFDLAALWLYFRQPAREISTMSLLVIGVLLLAGVILQRWNAYWVVGFFIMVFTDAGLELMKRRQFNFTEFLQAMRAPIVSGFAAFFLFAIVAWPKVVRTVTTDYADIYSAFQEDDSLISAFVRQVDAFGAGIYALILMSFVFLIASVPTRRVVLLLGIQLVYVFLHFSSTQTMGPHQYFLILPGLLVILSLGLASGISSDRRPIAITAAGAAVLVLAFGLASAKAVFVPSGAPENRSTNRLISQSYRPPLVSNDLDEFARMAEYIDESMVDAPAGLGIYVLSGSATLNSVHFNTITASTGARFNFADRILSSSVVDKRDGFPREILNAHIVISSDPIQLSRRPSDQQVIRIPADRMFNGTGIGAAFERLPDTFRLDGDVDAVVFRRTRPNTAEEIADLSDALREHYPDRPNVYQ